MAKTFTLFLSTSPYSYENTVSAVKIAESALNKGHTVNLIASGDGTIVFSKARKLKAYLMPRRHFQGLFKKD